MAILSFSFLRPKNLIVTHDSSLSRSLFSCSASPVNSIFKLRSESSTSHHLYSYKCGPHATVSHLGYCHNSQVASLCLFAPHDMAARLILLKLSYPQPAPSRARTLEAGERWARLAQARAASRRNSHQTQSSTMAVCSFNPVITD